MDAIYLIIIIQCHVSEFMAFNLCMSLNFPKHCVSAHQVLMAAAKN